MTITSLQNIENIENYLSVPKKNGLVISAFELEFEYDFENYEKDHCECISSSILKEGRKLIFTIVTQRNEIDEFITISTISKTKHYKIRLIR